MTNFVLLHWFTRFSLFFIMRLEISNDGGIEIAQFCCLDDAQVQNTFSRHETYGILLTINLTSHSIPGHLKRIANVDLPMDELCIPINIKYMELGV